MLDDREPIRWPSAFERGVFWLASRRQRTRGTAWAIRNQIAPLVGDGASGGTNLCGAPTGDFARCCLWCRVSTIWQRP